MSRSIFVRPNPNPINRAWQEAGVEPDLCDVLADPLVHAVMRRDGVSQAQLRHVVTRARVQLGIGPCRCAA
jgi:hypothetical protein